MVHSFEYPKKAQNTVKRYNDRGTYELGIIHSIVNETRVLHVSFQPGPDEPFPAILPMIGVMASYEYPSAGIEEPLECYLHGYVSSRLMRMAKSSEKGIPVCIAATALDGLVLSLTPNSHSYNYRSAVLQGYAKPVETDDEKVWAMRQITNKVVPQRYENSRVPPDNVEMTSTTILRVKIETGSGKIRHGEPHDDAKDLKRDEITQKVWTGVVPVYEAFGEPVPCSSNKVEDVPAYIAEYAVETSKRNKQKAIEATKEP